METILQAILLGIVEGLTEFLPISSTGHLIVVGDLIGFHNDGRVFEIAIQLGAILAVVVEYRRKFTDVALGMFKDEKSQRFILNLFIAFLPAALSCFAASASNGGSILSVGVFMCSGWLTSPPSLES